MVVARSRWPAYWRSGRWSSPHVPGRSAADAGRCGWTTGRPRHFRRCVGRSSTSWKDRMGRRSCGSTPIGATARRCGRTACDVRGDGPRTTATRWCRRPPPGPVGTWWFSPQVDQTVRGLEVIDVELDELLASHSTVAGKRDRQPVAQGFRCGGGQDPLPGVLVGDPGGLLDAPYQALSGSSAATACVPSADRVLLPQPVFHQVLVERPDRDQSLLDRRVGKPGLSLPGAHSPVG